MTEVASRDCLTAAVHHDAASFQQVRSQLVLGRVVCPDTGDERSRLDIGGREPTSPEHAVRILSSFEPGETVTFAIMRKQRRETVNYVIPGSRVEGL